MSYWQKVCGYIEWPERVQCMKPATSTIEGLSGQRVHMCQLHTEACVLAGCRIVDTFEPSPVQRDDQP